MDVGFEGRNDLGVGALRSKTRGFHPKRWTVNEFGGCVVVRASWGCLQRPGGLGLERPESECPSEDGEDNRGGCPDRRMRPRSGVRGVHENAEDIEKTFGMRQGMERSVKQARLINRMMCTRCCGRVKECEYDGVTGELENVPTGGG
jgi:hypothetical protein